MFKHLICYSLKIAVVVFFIYLLNPHYVREEKVTYIGDHVYPTVKSEMKVGW